MKKYFLLIIFFLLFTTKSFSENLKFKKIISLNDPWGCSFINKSELIITEKSGKIKIVNIISNKITSIEYNLNFSEYGQRVLLDIIYKNNSMWIS